MRPKDRAVRNKSVSKLYKGLFAVSEPRQLPHQVNDHARRLVFAVSRPQLRVKMHLARASGVFRRLPDFRVKPMKRALQVVGPRCTSCFGNTPLAEASHFARRRIMHPLDGTRPNKTFHEASKPRSWLVH